MHRPPRSVRKPIIEESSSEDESNSKLSPNSKTNHNTNENSSSSESDIENYLQPISKIDLSSSFFNLSKKYETDNKVEGDIPQTSRLSDSSDEDDVDKNSVSQNMENNEFEEQAINCARIGFQQMEEFKRKMEETKRHIEKYNEKRKSQNDDSTQEIIEVKDQKVLNLDISGLLALGETKKQLNLENIRKEDLHPSDFESSEGDWEEVKVSEKQENKDVQKTIPREGIQITVDAMSGNVKKKKAVDFLAAMKRRLNRIRKENQVYVHKVHLLCWIAHGNYVNMIINNTDLLSQALALLPSENSYPSDRTDLGYLEKIVQWYKKTVVVVDKPVPSKLDLLSCLQLQITRKQAFNNKMYVLIFISILRALGIHTRFVMSFQVEPLRPPASELHSLSKENQKSIKVKSKLTEKNTKPKNSSDKKMEFETKSSNNEKNNRSDNRPKLKSDERKTSQSKSSVNEHTNSRGKKQIREYENKKLVLEANSKISNSDTNKKKTGLKDRKVESNKLSKNQDVVNKTEKESYLRKKCVESKVSNDEKKNSSSTEKATKKRSAARATKVVEKMPKLENLRRSSRNIPQLDGGYNSSGSCSDEEINSLELLLQVDGPANIKNSKPSLQKIKVAKIPKTIHDEKSATESLKTASQQEKSNRKNPNNTKKSQTDESEDDFVTSSYKRVASNSNVNQLDVRNDIINLIKGRISEQKQIDRTRKVKKRSTPYEDTDSDSDYAPEPVKKKYHDSDSDNDYFVPKTKIKKRIRVKKEGTALKVISSDSDLDESGKKKKKGVNVWVEVFLEAEEKWISADIVKGQVHCVNEIYARTTHPVTYIVAWKNDNTLKDVTRRYCKNFSTVTRKLRIDPKWWEDTIKPFIGQQTMRCKKEDDDLNRQQLDQPMPKAISEYKNHPLYALERHLLKFEAIYPADQVPLGYVRGEAVYPRNSVYVCKSRDIWLKEALVVKPGEKPYKIVKARPKYDKLSNTVITDQMLEIFGPWQTMDYEPPTAENGVVPRNAFGNVELFKSCMLPKRTVHIKLAGLNKVCRRLNVDCASAIVGFDFHGGWSHPVYDGFVICEEFADKVIAAWELEQEEIERKENEKIEQRVYGNWKRLIKGLLIRERLKAKYDFGQPSTSNKSKKAKTSRPQ